MKLDWKSWLRSKKGGWIMVAAVTLGMILILLSSRTHSAAPTQKTDDAEQYRIQLEQKLCKVVSRITGESDSNKKQEKSDRKQKYILVEDADGGQQALVVTTLSPGIRGVVVVSELAADPLMKESILHAITTSLNIPSKKVCVVEGQS